MNTHSGLPRRCRPALAFFALVGALAVGTPSARAQASGDPAKPSDGAATRRSVGGHAYSQFETVEWPFVATRVVSSTGLGMRDRPLAQRERDERQHEGYRPVRRHIEALPPHRVVARDRAI